MKKSIFLIIIISLINNNLKSQIVEWTKTYGGSSFDNAASVKQTIDNGYIISGYSDSNDGDISENHGRDIWLIKLNSFGELEWEKAIGGSNYEDGWSVIQTSDFGYIVAGLTNSDDGDITENYGGTDCWIVKLNSEGIIEWEKSYGGSIDDEAYSVFQTDDLGYIFAGRSNSTDGDLNINKGGFDYWIVKLNSEGTIEWQKSFGGSGYDVPYSVKQTNDGGYIIAGETNSIDGDVSNSHGLNDAWIIKLNSEGELVWQKTIGGSDVDVVRRIELTVDGGFILGGCSGSNDGDVVGNHGSLDFWIIKLNSFGEIEWNKLIGGSNHDDGRSVVQIFNDEYIIAGLSKSFDGDFSENNGSFDFCIVKLNSNTNIEWQESFGGSQLENMYDGQKTIDGFIAVGSTESNDGDVFDNHGSADYWIVKISFPTNIFSKYDIKNQICIYPNPTTGLFLIKNKTNNNIFSIEIQDITGKTIYNKMAGQLNEQIDLSKYESGIYIIKVRTNKELYTTKLIKN